MMLVETTFCLDHFLQSSGDYLLVYFLSDCSYIPNEVITKNKTPNAVVIFCAEHFLTFDCEFYFYILSKTKIEKFFNIFTELFTTTR